MPCLLLLLPAPGGALAPSKTSISERVVIVYTSRGRKHGTQGCIHFSLHLHRLLLVTTHSGTSRHQGGTYKSYPACFAREEAHLSTSTRPNRYSRKPSARPVAVSSWNAWVQMMKWQHNDTTTRLHWRFKRMRCDRAREQAAGCGSPEARSPGHPAQHLQQAQRLQRLRCRHLEHLQGPTQSWSRFALLCTDSSRMTLVQSGITAQQGGAECSKEAASKHSQKQSMSTGASIITRGTMRSRPRRMRQPPPPPSLFALLASQVGCVAAQEERLRISCTCQHVYHTAVLL